MLNKHLLPTHPAFLLAKLLAEGYCKEQNLGQAPLRLCSTGCSEANCRGVQEQQHKPTSSAYNASVSGNRVGALLGGLQVLLGCTAFLETRRIPTGLYFDGSGAEEITLQKSLLDKLGVRLGSGKFVFP